MQWDELSPFLRPNQVSPWDIEHLIPSSDISQSSLKKKKHWLQLNEIGKRKHAYNHWFDKFMLPHENIFLILDIFIYRCNIIESLDMPRNWTTEHEFSYKCS